MSVVDRMQQEDKVKHIICAFLVVLLLLPVVSIWWAGAAVFAAGVLKEVWDSVSGTGFCWYDIVANAIGIVVAAALLPV